MKEIRRNNMYYFIFAAEDMYRGLHGIYDYDMVECIDYNEACEIGCEMSRYVIDSYIRPEDIYYSQEDFCVDQGYDEWNEDYWNEYYECLDEVIDGYVYFEVYAVKPEVTFEDYQAWQHENMEPHDFIERFCTQIEP